MYPEVETVKLVNGARIFLPKSPKSQTHTISLLRLPIFSRRNIERRTYEHPNLNALTIVLILSNLLLSHSSPSNSGEVTDDMTRKVLRSNKTISAAEVTWSKWVRWERRDEREGMRWAITTDQAFRSNPTPQKVSKYCTLGRKRMTKTKN